MTSLQRTLDIQIHTDSNITEKVTVKYVCENSYMQTELSINYMQSHFFLKKTYLLEIVCVGVGGWVWWLE